MKNWTPLLEQGFPCPHLRLKSYFIEQTTWKQLYEAYKLEFDNLPPGERDFSLKLMAYSTFLQYVHHKSPGIFYSKYVKLLSKCNSFYDRFTVNQS